MSPTRGLATALLAAAACASCDGGGVAISFELPASELAPDRARLATITLVSWGPESPRRSETREVGHTDGPIDMGRLPIGASLRLAVELRSPTQRLIGYGRSTGPIDVTDGDEVAIPINIRRPFAYVAGKLPALSAFDPTVDSGRGKAVSVPVSGATASAPTPDGRDLVVVSAGENGSGTLVLVSTADHSPRALPQVELGRAPADVAVSADGRIAAVAHPGESGGLSLVDLNALRAGEADVATMIELGSVGAVAVAGAGSDTRAFALVDRFAGEPRCAAPGPNSSIVAVSGDGSVLATIEYGSRLHDLAAAEDGSRLVVADTCAGELVLVPALGDGPPTTLASLPLATAVAIEGNQVWGAGSLPAEPARRLGGRIQLVSVDLDGGSETSLLLPPAQEIALTLDFDDPGQAPEIRIDADSVFATELAVVPGADQIALITRGFFHAAEQLDPVFNIKVFPEITIDTSEYLLVETANASIASRVRTWCDLWWDDDPFDQPVFIDWVCTSAPGQEVVEPDYEPLHLSILYGAK